MFLIVKKYKWRGWPCKPSFSKRHRKYRDWVTIILKLLWYLSSQEFVTVVHGFGNLMTYNRGRSVSRHSSLERKEVLDFNSEVRWLATNAMRDLRKRGRLVEIQFIAGDRGCRRLSFWTSGSLDGFQFIASDRGCSHLSFETRLDGLQFFAGDRWCGALSFKTFGFLVGRS